MFARMWPFGPIDELEQLAGRGQDSCSLTWRIFRSESSARIPFFLISTAQEWQIQNSKEEI